MSSPAPERESTLELGFATYFDGIEIGSGATVRQTLGTTRLGTDLQELVAEHGAVIRVRRAGGTEEAKDGRPRLAIEVYAASYDDAWGAAKAVKTKMTSRPFFRAGGYRIDKVRNESANTEQPHPNLRVVTSVWRITTRDPI